MIFATMTRRFFFKALAPGVAVSALALAGCSTVETRISGHPEMYQRLSARDQALVSQGQIRDGMSRNAVWLAWGSPGQKIIGNMRGRATETWVYVRYSTYYTYPYPFYGPAYEMGYGFGLTTVGLAGRYRSYNGCNFVYFGSPFYDPFFYSYIPPSIPYPYKVVTFADGRVVSFQFMVPPYR
jgi:hypothetical protein